MLEKMILEYIQQCIQDGNSDDLAIIFANFGLVAIGVPPEALGELLQDKLFMPLSCAMSNSFLANNLTSNDWLDPEKKDNILNAFNDAAMNYKLRAV